MVRQENGKWRRKFSSAKSVFGALVHGTKHVFLKYLYLNNHNSYLDKNRNIAYQIVNKALYEIKILNLYFI